MTVQCTEKTPFYLILFLPCTQMVMKWTQAHWCTYGSKAEETVAEGRGQQAGGGEHDQAVGRAIIGCLEEHQLGATLKQSYEPRYPQTCSSK